jgi:UDP:flavonoid glycosyltransferase YjiC (YdhE family)
VASGPDAADPVTRRGLSFRQAGPSFGDWYGRLRARTRGTPGDGLAPDRVERYFIPRLFAEVGAPAMVDDLLAVAGDLRPDLVVFDSLAYAGPLVATALAVPAVHHTVGPVMDAEVVELAADALSPLWRQFGVDVSDDAGTTLGKTVTICPLTLDPRGATIPRTVPMRPTDLPAHPAAPTEVPPDVWERPVVYVTLGTFSNSNLAVFRLLLDAAADLPVNVVATVGNDNDPSALAPIPPNAWVARFIPQAELLPHCGAAISHAGAGTIFGILAHGLPSVAVPQSADNFRIAGLLDAAGAARVVMPADLSAETVREALSVVLADGGHRAAAASVAGEIAEMPPPKDVARALRDWAQTR